MTSDRTLERKDPDWSLYVSDFPSSQWEPDGWVSASLHVRTTARLKVEGAATEFQGPQVRVAFGPHAQIFIPRALASRLRELLDDMFSAGVSVGVSPPPLSPTSAVKAASPAEPTKEG